MRMYQTHPRYSVARLKQMIEKRWSSRLFTEHFPESTSGQRTTIVCSPRGTRYPLTGERGNMRFGDAYIKHDDGTLDVIRGGGKRPFSYATGEWTDVEGDPRKWKKRRFRR